MDCLLKEYGTWREWRFEVARLDNAVFDLAFVVIAIGTVLSNGMKARMERVGSFQVKTHVPEFLLRVQKSEGRSP
jgi:hypothetical protein